ncbi:MAG: T9SS type A sorting domain-containing protein [Bacteroidia bacterium]|nr:T9SS type A sorting domain-containing protein [Bacteroidia bacterium]
MGRLATFTLFLLFILSASSANGQVAKITFSNPREETGMQFVVSTNPSAEAYSEQTIRDQLDCRYIPSGKYGYFRVDDGLILTTDAKLIFNITYFDSGNEIFSFQYNSLTSNYKSVTITKTNSNTWINVTVGLVDAAFNNLQNNQSDFRISGEAFIRQISISKGELDPSKEPVPVTSGSSYSEFKGKSVAGYQAWFTASESNSGWVHWSSNTRPEVGNFSFDIYPDTRDYMPEILKQTGFDNLGNGEPSLLFSSADVIDEHFKWMKDAGIDGVALQRFIGDNPYPISDSPFSKPLKVKQASESNGRIFYICYDMSSGKDENAWAESIKYDWVFNIEQSYALTSSPAYATVNNKPVVQIWGPGFTSRVGNAAKTIELIKFLQSRGCYVIGGVPTNWRTESSDSKPGFLEAYKTYDMVSPWTPGRYKNISGCDSHKTNYLVPDKAFCDANNLDYLPVLFPGFSWSTWNIGAPNSIPRIAGEFLWRQAYNIKSTGINQMYFAMFDEYDEGTAIMKAATDWSMIPTNQYFVTLSTDGIWVSSDFYLRVAGVATAMAKSPDEPSQVLSVPHSQGPDYYRNSFEKRYTEYVEKEGGEVKNGIFNLDPCFHNEVTLGSSNVSLPTCEIIKDDVNSNRGSYSVRTTGSPTSSNTAFYNYKIAEVSIPVVADLQFSFWKKTDNEPGKYVSVDLMFKSGKKLSKLINYRNNLGLSMDPSSGIGRVGVGWENITCKIGEGELVGDEITGILITYDKPASSGSYLAYFDDIFISTREDAYNAIEEVHDKEKVQYVFSGNQRLIFDAAVLNSTIKIYDISGKLVADFVLGSIEVPVNLINGIYIVMMINKQRVYSQKIIL